jgi:hypothetical protein
MANEHRGEVEIELARADGEERDKLALRPTFAAIIEIEQELGTGLAEVLSRFRDPPRWGLRDVAAIVCAGLKAADHRERRELILERIMRSGLGPLALPCLQFCVNAWFGGRDPTMSQLTPSPPELAAATASANGSASAAAS